MRDAGRDRNRNAHQVLKYGVMVAASKAFSATPATRRAYRTLGNAALDRIRSSSGVTAPYLDRARRLLEICDRFAVLRPGDAVLELGTGWLHWEATVLRLHHDVEVTLFDVVDNRLFPTYLRWVAQYGRHVAASAELSPQRRARVAGLVADIAAVESFEELYALLGFRYVLEPSGRLDGLPAEHYALVVSADVLEHVDGAMLPEYLAASAARLRPGGHAIHRIDLVDHYHYFDPSTSPKHYYRYDDRTWRRWFAADVQYVNRVQVPQWRTLLREAGLDPVEEHTDRGDVVAVPRAAEFAGLSGDDVDTLQLTTVHRRPLAPARTAPSSHAPARRPTPAVSVCVPVHQGERFLAATLRHVLAQTMDDVEVLVLDNQSTDASAEIARSFGERVRLEHTDELLPPGDNWNLAISRSRAPLVKLVCADDLLHPRCLEVQAAALDAAPGVAMVAHRQDLVDVAGRILAPARFLRGLLGVHDRDAIVRRTVRSGINPIGATAGVMFRRTAFEAAGGFRNDREFVTDVDLYLRLVEHGTLLGLRESLASFRIAPGTLSAAASRREYDTQRRFTQEIAASTAPGVVRGRDELVGLLAAPVGRLRRHAAFAAGRLAARI